MYAITEQSWLQRCKRYKLKITAFFVLPYTTFYNIARNAWSA